MRFDASNFKARVLSGLLLVVIVVAHFIFVTIKVLKLNLVGLSHLRVELYDRPSRTELHPNHKGVNLLPASCPVTLELVVEH